MKVTESMTEDEARSERLMKKKTNEINFLNCAPFVGHC